jgi:hypothetical protein
MAGHIWPPQRSSGSCCWPHPAGKAQRRSAKDPNARACRHCILVSLHLAPISPCPLRVLLSFLASSGIINASKHLTVPIYPFVPLAEDIQDENAPVPTLWSLFGASPSELRDEFVFHGLFDKGLTDDLALLLVAMQRYGHSVQLFVDGALSDLDFAQFCDRRNLIQYTMLSIPSQKDLPDPTSPRPIYEPTRLAMLIYSLTVIFPLPPQTAPIAALTGQLKAALQQTDLRSTWSSSHQAGRLLWILLVGSLAARDVPEDRNWFVAMLRRLTAKESRVRKFEDLKTEVLSRILWLDRSCDAAGRLLWAEIQEKNVP